MKIPLTVSENYVSDWSLYAGVREFVQNARDATREGCTCNITYSADERTLRVRTVGATLDHRSLLLGESSKRGNNQMIGRHGDGYKSGSLALLRLGKSIKIRTGDEVWVPAVEYSTKFRAKVLTFDITAGRKHKNEVTVDIAGIETAEWDDLRHQFLFTDDRPVSAIESPVGTALVDRAGEIYVDGIFVCKLGELLHGYNFNPRDVKLDRDRRLLDYWDVKTLTSRVWEAIYTNDPTHDQMIETMLAAGNQDTEHFRYSWCTGVATRQKVAQSFKAKFGESAIAVRTDSEQREMEFYGRKAQVVASEPLRQILEEQIGTAEQARRDLGQHLKAEHSIATLSPSEAKNYMMALDFVSKAIKRCGFNIAGNISIAEFASASVMGMRKDGKIYLSRNTLTSFKEALKTMVEEVAHEVGADGTHDHVERMHEIYAAGVSVLTLTPDQATDAECQTNSTTQTASTTSPPQAPTSSPTDPLNDYLF